MEAIFADGLSVPGEIDRKRLKNKLIKYASKKHRDALKERGIQVKAVKNKPFSPRQLARNKAINKVRFVVERTFAGQQRWFAGKSCVTRAWPKRIPGTFCWQSLTTCEGYQGFMLKAHCLDCRRENPTNSREK